MADKSGKVLKKLKKKQRRMRAAMAAAGMAPGMAAGMNQGQGLLGGLTSLLPSRRSEQFLLGLVLGAGAAYVLSDEEMRAKIMKSGMKLYASLAGGLAEMKEQAADIQAELQAEQAGVP